MQAHNSQPAAPRAGATLQAITGPGNFPIHGKQNKNKLQPHSIYINRTTRAGYCQGHTQWTFLQHFAAQCY